MTTTLTILVLLLLALLGAASVWALSLSAIKEDWKTLLPGFIFPPLLALWHFYQGERPKAGSESRYLIDGLLLSGSLFFPFWVTASLLVFLVLLETYLELREEEALENKDERQTEDQ
jgi:hypothetical protein